MQVWYENVPFRYHLLPIYNSYLVYDPPGGVINRSKNLQMCVGYVKLRRIPPPVASLRVAPMFQSSHSSPTPSPRAQWNLYNGTTPYGFKPQSYFSLDSGGRASSFWAGMFHWTDGGTTDPRCYHMQWNNLGGQGGPWLLYGELDFEFKPGYRACLIQS